jgi:magnesium chelatase subunit I
VWFQLQHWVRKLSWFYGEQEGAAKLHFTGWCNSYFISNFQKSKKLERNEKNAYSDLLEWFAETGFELLRWSTDSEYRSIFELSLETLDVYKEIPTKNERYFIEFILWAMVEYEKLSKNWELRKSIQRFIQQFYK